MTFRQLAALFTLALIVPVSNSIAQANTAAAAHGTVNVLLANHNGLVLATDSRISGGLSTTGTKLFLVDDHTVCSIAGWYSVSGPSLDGMHYPAFVAIPGIIEHFVASQPFTKNTSFEEKVRRLSDVVAFSLSQVATISRASGYTGSLTESWLLIASTDESGFRVAKVLVKPSASDDRLYEPEPPEFFTSDGRLLYVGSGITNVVDKVFETGSNSLSDSAAIHYLHEEMSTNGGSSLSVHDMEQIGRALVSATSASYPSVVGGPLQMVAIQDGRVEQLAKLDDDPTPASKLLLLITQSVVINNLSSGVGGVSVPRDDKVAAIVTHSTFIGIVQQLDRIMFLNTILSHCKLSYVGEAEFYIDKSSMIEDCVLNIGPKVPKDSAVVQRLAETFPSLEIKWP